WCQEFSLVIDAYRHMLRLEDELSIKAFQLAALEQLAKNCPRCFGPLQKDEQEELNGPHYIVCVDRNCQHHQYKASRQEYIEKKLVLPSLFIKPRYV
ncbi:hypothetical protein DFH28DRAFT_850244, partial [Melampsora americana]